MASLDSLQVRAALARGVTIQKGTDTPIAFRMRNVAGGAVTSVTTTTATNIVIITANGGTDTYAFATYTTIGAVVDAINADGIFEAKILDALRSLASASTLVTGAITAGTDSNGVVVWDALQDTSASLQIAVCLSNRRNFDEPKGHRVKLQQVVYAVNMGTAAADSFQIYLRRGTTETLAFSALSVDTTETTLNLALGMGTLTGKDEDEYVVLVKDAATLADATTNFVRVVGILE